MGTLRDTTYENLDYLSQLTEVVIGPQNDVLALVPDRIELNFELLNKCKYPVWGMQGFEVTQASILKYFIPKDKQSFIHDIHQYFEFEVSPDFDLDLANNHMVGSITLVKKSQQMDEKKVLEIAVDQAIRNLDRYSWNSKRIKERCITILNLFEANKGTEWAKQLEGRVSYKAAYAIEAALREAILENKWRIRDAAIITKIGSWISDYMKDEGDSSMGLVNLIKLKIMLDKDLPVYSIDEVKHGNTTGTP